MKLAGHRSGSWCFMDHFVIPNFDGDGNYLDRLRIVQTPLFGVYLHRFDGPDSRPTLHDHPWPFISFVLRGSYIERRLNLHTLKVNETRRVRFVNVMPKGGAHSIMSLGRTPTWTLMFVGRRYRTWGYWEDQGGGTWRWTEFDKHPHNAEFLAAMARRKAQ